MSLLPSSSRSRLTWKVFNREDDSRWRLVLPPYYAKLFEVSFPSLMKKMIAGFADSSTGKTRIGVFRNLDGQDVKRIQAILDWYERAVCLGTNKHIVMSFSDELDFCLALDMLRTAPREGRTEIGEWEFQAKYNQCTISLARLAETVCRAIRLLPPPTVPKPRVLSYVPSNPNKKFHMPADLTELVLKTLPAAFLDSEAPLLVPRLTAQKKATKDLPIAQKIAEWGKLFEGKSIQLSRPVKGCSVIVLDDLYQSGVSLWSYAKYLKAKGATTVAGLSCVKSLRDTDNK